MSRKKVMVEVSVDLEKWRAEYGLEPESDALTLAKVTQDVEAWVIDAIDKCGLDGCMEMI